MPLTFSPEQYACAAVAGKPCAAKQFASPDTWNNYQNEWWRRFCPDKVFSLVGDSDRRLQWTAATRHWNLMNESWKRKHGVGGPTTTSASSAASAAAASISFASSSSASEAPPHPTPTPSHRLVIATLYTSIVTGPPQMPPSSPTTTTSLLYHPPPLPPPSSTTSLLYHLPPLPPPSQGYHHQQLIWCPV